MEDIIFDTQSGISIEEQREILYQINNITEKNRRSLAETETAALKTKKKELVFPLAVNIAAVIILLAGTFSMFFLNARKDLQIRSGTGLYSAADQVIIGELTAAQQEALLTLQELSREQEKAAGIDAYLSGGISVIADHVINSRFDQAAESASELLLFLNTASFETNRPFMSRKEFYVKSVDSVSKLTEDIRKAGGNYIVEIEAKNAALEESVSSMQKTLDSLSEGSGGQARRIIQLEDTIQEKDRTITSLENEKNNLTQTVSDLRTVNSEQETAIMQLNDQLTNIRQVLQALSQ